MYSNISYETFEDIPDLKPNMGCGSMIGFIVALLAMCFIIEKCAT